MKRIILLSLALCLLLLPLCSCKRQYVDEDPVDPNDFMPTDTPEAAEERYTVFIVGDSTAETYLNADKSVQSAKVGKDIMGWGYYLSFYFNEKVEVKNLARSGRGTRSFLGTPEYRTLWQELSEGDYLFIQFAHNDRKKDSYHTDANLALEEVDSSCKNADGLYSYQASLYYNYIRLAQDRKANVVLLTPISLLNLESGLSANDPHADYILALKDLAADLDLPLLDVTAATEALYEKTKNEGGKEKTLSFHAFTDAARTERDITHLSHLGAYTVAGEIATLIQKTIPVLQDQLAETPRAYDN